MQRTETKTVTFLLMESDNPDDRFAVVVQVNANNEPTSIKFNGHSIGPTVLLRVAELIRSEFYSGRHVCPDHGMGKEYSYECAECERIKDAAAPAKTDTQRLTEAADEKLDDLRTRLAAVPDF